MDPDPGNPGTVIFRQIGSVQTTKEGIIKEG